jgi:23S rRNA (adenine1618-N6)-methyltransferase
MPAQSHTSSEEKLNLHPRNPHRFRYDFAKLIEVSPELGAFVSLNEFQDFSIDFKDAEAVKALNRSLLKQFYGISHWDIPNGYLCPPVPGRADYIHYMADLLASANQGTIPRGKAVKVLDIGTGANCIYPLIGHQEYGWSFVGSETDHLAIRSATNIVDANGLSKAIEIRRQRSPVNIFEGIIHSGEVFNLSICNPPFHSSAAEAKEGSRRKWKNLGHKKEADTMLNFGGQSHELWCEGGEEGFILKMIRESLIFSKNFRWFSSLISKKTTLPIAFHALEKVQAAEIKTIEMSQGQKTSRVLAWRFI